MKTTVKERLKEFLQFKGIGQIKFAETVGLSRGFVNNISQSIQPKTLDRISKCYPELNTGWLLTGDGNMILGEDSDGNKMVGLPLIPVNAMAGALSGGADAIMQYDCEHYVVPIFHGAEFLIRVEGDSMIPKYMSGDIVACQRVPMSGLWFQWGKTYVIDTQQGALIKRIEPSGKEGFVTIFSENKSYKPFDLPVTEINGVALVKGIIRVE